MKRTLLTIVFFAVAGPSAAQPTSEVYDAARGAGASEMEVSTLAAATRSLASTSEARFAPVAGAGDYRFGVSVSLSGDRALVGAFEDPDGGRRGAAYVFVRSGSTWTREAKLVAADGAFKEYFGASVSLVGDKALVGAPYDDNRGAAYVFGRSGGVWTQEAKLVLPGGEAAFGFGGGVALSPSGVRALVGTDNRSAHVFARSGDNWVYEARLVNSDTALGDHFGQAVALSDDRALVGAIFSGTSFEGAAYVFVRSGNTWSQEARLTASDGAQASYFGNSVSLSGDRALVGAPRRLGSRGVAYTFVRSDDTWTQEARLVASDGASGDQFGASVSLSGDRSLVGAPRDGNETEYPGSVYVISEIGPVTSEPGATVGLALAIVPSPVGPSGGRVRSEVPTAGPVYVTVLDVLGREVAVL